MICPKCKKSYPAPQKFCSSCSDDNNRAMKLVEHLEVSPQAWLQYKKIVEQCLVDGFLEENEKQILATMRTNLGIPEKMHEELLSQFSFTDQFPVKLVYNVDVVKGYGANQHCLALLRLLHVDAMPFKKITCTYHLNNEEKQEYILQNSMPNAVHDVSLPFFPKMAGQYSLFLSLSIEDFMGKQQNFIGTPYQFQVHAHVAPTAVHIHQTGERIYGANSVDVAQEKKTAFLGDGRWMEIALKPMQVEVQQRAVQGHILPSLSAMPSLARAELWFAPAKQPTRKLYVSGKNRVSFGRALDKADLRIAYEPYKEEKGYTALEIQNNIEASALISRAHLEIWLQGNQVMIQDIGSNSGTSVNGVQLVSKQPVVLENDAEVVVASRTPQSLSFTVSIFPDGAGVLLRQRHYIYREHLILWKKVGISDCSRGAVALFDPTKHTYALENIQGQLCFVNYTGLTQNLLGMKVGHAQGIPLQHQMIFDIASTMITVDKI